MPANSSAGCDYSASLDTKTDGTNTATVSFGGGSFEASADYVFGEPTNVIGYADINVTDTQPDSSAPWMTSTDDAWAYAGDFDCPTDENLYTDGIYTYSVPNVAEITETGQNADANVHTTCYIPANSKVIKTTTEGDEDIGQFPFTFELYDPAGELVESQDLNAAGEIHFVADLLLEGTWMVTDGYRAMKLANPAPATGRLSRFASPVPALERRFRPGGLELQHRLRRSRRGDRAGLSVSVRIRSNGISLAIF